MIVIKIVIGDSWLELEQNGNPLNHRLCRLDKTSVGAQFATQFHGHSTFATQFHGHSMSLVQSIWMNPQMIARGGILSILRFKIRMSWFNLVALLINPVVFHGVKKYVEFAVLFLRRCPLGRKAIPD